MERVKGIEPSSSAWKAVALPLSYTRFFVSRAKAAKLPPYILDVLQLPTSNRTAPRFYAP